MISSETFDFETDEEIETIADKLIGVSPETFSSSLTYSEKVRLLLFLVNTAHDL